MTSNQQASPTAMRVLFTWLCALSPALLTSVCIISVPLFRLAFGCWPDQVLSLSEKQLNFGVPIALMVWIVLFALIHLIVAVIHHRQVGFRPSQSALFVATYGAGLVLFVVVMATVPVAAWWLD